MSQKSIVKQGKSKFGFPTRLVAYTGIMTGMVTVASLLGFSTAQFYFNVGDTVILLTAAIFGPVPAMLAGGLGAFFADMAVYPATMWFTLVIKGLEGLICGLLLGIINSKIKKKHLKVILSVLSMAVSSFFMMCGYFICQTFIYGTYAAALVALPMDAVQAVVSTALASVLLYIMRFINFKEKIRPVSKTEHNYKRNAAQNNLPEDGKDDAEFDNS